MPPSLGECSLPPGIGSDLAFAASTVFSSLVLGPLTTAAAHLVSDRVEKGLEELSPDRLRGELKGAIRSVAAHAATSPEAVERLLPMSEVETLLARVGPAQSAAVMAWRSHAGGLGGLLGRSSQVPGDPGAPTVSDRLRALADTMQRDKVVADPLHAFAHELAAWEALAARLVAIVGASPELRRSYRLRQARDLAIAATLVAIVVAVAVVVRGRMIARDNVLAAIGKEDPCAALDLAEVDLGRVSADLVAKVAERRGTCEANRAEAARRAEEERLREEREEAARKAREKLEADCATLATHVEAGKLTPEDQAFASDAALTARVAEGNLEGRDIGPGDPKMPCAGTKSEERLWAAYRKAIVTKPWVLLGATAPAPRARAAFVPDGGKMPFGLRKVIATRANDLAKAAARSKKLEDAARAAAWCEVARAVGMPMAGPCDLADRRLRAK